MAAAPDPLLASARQLLDDALGVIERSLDGLGREALEWRPAARDANSLAVLAVHALHSTRSWLAVATGAALPARDRAAEFAATAADADALRASVRALGDECRALLAGAAPVDWAAVRATHPRPAPADAREVSAAWALLHAIEHLREHAGQMSLTRQLREPAAS